MSEATDPRADPNDYQGGWRYVADPPVTDWVEKTKLDRMDEYRKEAGEGANLNGLIFPIRKLEGLFCVPDFRITPH